MRADRDITLVLFDIDGTLLDVHGAGRQAFSNTLRTIFGWDDDLREIRFAGATDLDLLRRIMGRHGRMPNADDEARFFAQLPIELEETLGRTQVTLYPGVRDLLSILGKYPHVLVGLVTGNIESCAKIKLDHFDLHDHFMLGAFGHEHADRDQIAGLALMRAKRTLQTGQQIRRRYLIGDTPSDIAAAAAIGAVSIAVATGSHTIRELEQAGADHALANLAHVEGLLKLMGVG